MIKNVSRQSLLRRLAQLFNRSFAHHRQSRWRSSLILAILLIAWSALLGVGLAQATEPRSTGIMAEPDQRILLAQATGSSAVGTVDVVPPAQQLGQDLYLENCASCHIGLPPQIFPTDTWRNLLQDDSHYGVQINPFRPPTLLVVWNYIRTFSRPVLLNEQAPYRIEDSRYFKALHPRVEFRDRVQIDSCAQCHPSAQQFNFRQLTPEWENAP
ncbi:cytochrome C [Oscillatoria sp. FACHB-1407]|nr:cytochrome C [Oscillatoria sp. FACHB-1407]